MAERGIAAPLMLPETMQRMLGYQTDIPIQRGPDMLAGPLIPMPFHSTGKRGEIPVPEPRPAYRGGIEYGKPTDSGLASGGGSGRGLAEAEVGIVTPHAVKGEE